MSTLSGMSPCFTLLSAVSYIYIYIFFFLFLCVCGKNVEKRPKIEEKTLWKSVENGQGLCLTNTSEAIPLRFEK